MVDEVAGGLHGHPAEKIRPGFGQLVDVQQCLQWEDTFWTSWARSPGSCGGCSSLPSCLGHHSKWRGVSKPRPGQLQNIM